MRKLISVLLALSLVLAVAGCSSKKAPEEGLRKLTLSEVTHSVFYAPQYAAMELGFFKDEGIELELISGQGADKVMTSVLSGEVEIGLAGPEACIYVFNQGKEDYPVIFAQLTKRDGSFLVAHEKPEDFKWENIAGKHILGGRKGGVPNMTLEYTLRLKGLDPVNGMNMDTGVQFALMAGAFTSGQGDYVTLFEPTASMIEAEGKGYIVASIGEASGEIPYTAYFAHQSYLTKEADLVQRFTNAVAKGQKWVQENDAETIAKTIAPHFPDSSIEILTKVAERYKNIDAWNTTPVMKKEAMERLCEVMIDAGELAEVVNFEKLVNNNFAAAVKS